MGYAHGPFGAMVASAPHIRKYATPLGDGWGHTNNNIFAKLFLEIFIHISSTYNNRFFVLLNSKLFTIVFKSTSWLRISAKISSAGLSMKVLCDKIIFVLFKL